MERESMAAKYRAIAYIDGFNLYYGIRRMYENLFTPYDPLRWREAIWLDIVKLAESFFITKK
jgi:hypothetical protein